MTKKLPVASDSQQMAVYTKLLVVYDSTEHIVRGRPVFFLSFMSRLAVYLP